MPGLQTLEVAHSKYQVNNDFKNKEKREGNTNKLYVFHPNQAVFLLYLNVSGDCVSCVYSIVDMEVSEAQNLRSAGP